VVGLKADEGWKVRVPCVAGGDAIGSAVHGEEVVVVDGKGLGGDTPGPEVGEAGEAPGPLYLWAGGCDGDSNEETDDGDGHEALDDGKGLAMGRRNAGHEGCLGH